MLLRRGLLAGAVLLTACRSVQRVQPAKFIPEKQPKTVWIATGDGLRELDAPLIATSDGCCSIGP